MGILEGQMDGTRISYGGRLYFRPMVEEDAYAVCRWYNLNAARRRLYNQGVYTPDTHIAAMRNRAPHDLIWMVCEKEPIGMTSLTISPQDYTAEYGRAFIDPAYRNQGYGTEQVYMTLAMAFEFFGLTSLWADVREDNEPARKMYLRTGWQDKGLDVHGHPSDRGPVWHIEYPVEIWPEYRHRFIERFGVTL